jgi:hypothetical protein
MRKNKNSEITKYGIVALLVYFISTMKRTQNTQSENTQDVPSRVPNEENNTNGTDTSSTPPIKDFDPYGGRVPNNPTIPPVDNVYDEGQIPEGEDNTRHPPGNQTDRTGFTYDPTDEAGWTGEPLDNGGFVRDRPTDGSVLRDIVDPRTPSVDPRNNPPRNPNAPPVGTGFIPPTNTPSIPPRRTPIDGLRPPKNPFGLNSSGDKHPYSRLIFPQVVGSPKDLNISPLLYGDIDTVEPFPSRSIFRSGVGYSIDQPIMEPLVPVKPVKPITTIGQPEPVKLHGLALWKHNYYKNLKK